MMREKERRTEYIQLPHPKFNLKIHENDLPSGGQREINC
jgi:hypothetical protein